jgi:flagellar basal-body rod protein FlgB
VSRGSARVAVTWALTGAATTSRRVRSDFIAAASQHPRQPLGTAIAKRAGMTILTRYFGTHATALQARAARMDMLASNIANAATPGFKARDFDMAALLGAGGNALPLAASDGRHIAAGAARAEPGYRVPLQASADGNTVELATEQVQFAENAVAYRATLAFLNSRVSTLMTAIKGE